MQHNPDLIQQLLTVENLARWLETQDPETEYDFCDVGDCLLCRFGQAVGLSDVKAGGGHIAFADRIGRRRVNVSGMTLSEPGRHIAVAFPWTYGAALERCREALKEMAA